MKVFNMLTSEDIKRIQSQADLALLIEQYRKEIWEWKQKESKWLSDKNLLEGSKKTIEELVSKMVEISKINLDLKNNRPLNTMDEIAYRELEAESKKLKEDLAQEKVDHEYDKAVHARELEKALQK